MWLDSSENCLFGVSVTYQFLLKCTQLLLMGTQPLCRLISFSIIFLIWKDSSKGHGCWLLEQVNRFDWESQVARDRHMDWCRSDPYVSGCLSSWHKMFKWRKGKDSERCHVMIHIRPFHFTNKFKGTYSNIPSTMLSGVSCSRRITCFSPTISLPRATSNIACRQYAEENYKKYMRITQLTVKRT